MRIQLIGVVATSLVLSGCFEVENGPAFSGGDEVPGMEGTLYPVGKIHPSDGPEIQLIEEDDGETWNLRRALNGSYIMTQVGGNDDDDGDDEMILRPRLIRQGEYVMEYSSASDENFLGILSVDEAAGERRYIFCISLEWDDDDIVAIAPEHNVRARDVTYGGVSLAADDPEDLFRYMADLRSRTEIGEWECSVLSATPPADRQVKTPAND